MKKILQSKKPPVIPLLGAPGVKLSRTTLRQNLVNANIQFTSLSLLLEKFQPDGIFPLMDLTIEPEALGLKVEFPANAPPYVKEHPIKAAKDLVSLKKTWKGIGGRMTVFIQVIRKIREHFSVLCGAYVLGPFTLAGELTGLTDFLRMVILDPGLAKEILEFATQVVKEYAQELLAAGADFITILDPTSVILSPKQFDEFSAPYIREMVVNLGGFTILHICGTADHLAEKMLETGVCGLSLDSPVDLRQVAERVPEKLVIMGNLDPVAVFLQGTPETVERKTRELLDMMEGVGNFILSSGCDIPLETPLENISAFMRAGRIGWG